MNSEIKKIVKEIFTEQVGGNVRICPRCGENSMERNIYRNALSRRERVYICPSCGISEAVEDMMKSKDEKFQSLPVDRWFEVKKRIKEKNAVEFYFDI